MEATRYVNAVAKIFNLSAAKEGVFLICIGDKKRMTSYCSELVLSWLLNTVHNLLRMSRSIFEKFPGEFSSAYEHESTGWLVSVVIRTYSPLSTLFPSEQFTAWGGVQRATQWQSLAKHLQTLSTYFSYNSTLTKTHLLLLIRANTLYSHLVWSRFCRRTPLCTVLQPKAGLFATFCQHTTAAIFVALCYVA